MKLPIGQQTRSVNGIQERGGHLYFGFDLAESANGSTLRKYYSYAELRAIPGNLDELSETVATYDWAIATRELFRSPLHAYWNERSLYEAHLWTEIEAALKEPPPRELELVDYDMPWLSYPAPVVLTLTPELAANVNHAIGVEIKAAA